MAQQNLDLFYPQVLTKDGTLIPEKVSEAVKRAFDFIYKIDPPAGSTRPSSITVVNENVGGLNLQHPLQTHW